MYDQLYRLISEEILNLKKEIVTWQSDALKGQEVCPSSPFFTCSNSRSVIVSPP
jgi:hypothetical protein